MHPTLIYPDNENMLWMQWLEGIYNFQVSESFPEIKTQSSIQPWYIPTSGYGCNGREGSVISKWVTLPQRQVNAPNTNTSPLMGMDDMCMVKQLICIINITALELRFTYFVKTRRDSYFVFSPN